MRILAFVAFLALGLMMSSCEQGEKKHFVMIETDMGDMKVELYNSTPLHRDNFLKLAGEGYYDGLLFHRVMQGFMIQGGDPDSKGSAPGANLGMGGPGYTIDAEIGAPHFKGTLAAARTGQGNPEKKSSGSQFYLTQGKPVTAQQITQSEQRKGIVYNESQKKKYLELGGAISLDMDYTVFGEIVEGLDIVDKIAAVKTNNRSRPDVDVTMKIRVL